MKRINYFFIVLMCHTSCCIILHAQDISISFSICDEALTPTDTLNPYLAINYHNISSSPYYFPALSYSGFTVPTFSMGTFWGTNLPYISRDEIFELLHEYHNDSFTLSLDYLEAQNGEGWSLSQGDGWSFIDACLYLYYRPFYTTHEDCVSFTLKELDKACLLRSSRALMFLKAGQAKEEKVSLRGIKEAGIKLTICLEKNTASNTVYIEPTSCFPYGKNMDLPPKVLDYSLYRGYFISSEFKIDFSHN